MINKIINIAKETGKIHLKHYKCDIDINHKGGDKYDYLTKADLESDIFIREEIRKLFPNDYILSEETEEGDIDYSSRVWIVDPLDGTKDYTACNDAFSVLIGLCEDGAPTLGVVYAAAHDILWYAEKGKGAYRVKDRKMEKIHVSSVSKISDAVQITKNFHGESRPQDILVKNLGAKAESPDGSVGIKFSRIASGDGDIHINTNFRCSKWDTCAPQIILEEAGGKVSTIDGDPLDYKQKGLRWERSFVGTNGLLHEKVLKTISPYLPQIS